MDCKSTSWGDASATQVQRRFDACATLVQRKTHCYMGHAPRVQAGTKNPGRTGVCDGTLLAQQAGRALCRAAIFAIRLSGAHAPRQMAKTKNNSCSLFHLVFKPTACRKTMIRAISRWHYLNLPFIKPRLSCASARCASTSPCSAALL